jgi:hypothetical protein
LGRRGGYLRAGSESTIMIIQVDNPPSSILIQRRVKEETDEDYLFITQINNVHFTKIEEFDAYFNDVNRGGDSPNAVKRLIDSHFVVVPLTQLRKFLEDPSN